MIGRCGGVVRADAAVWRAREQRLLLSMCTRLVAARDYGPAVGILEELCARQPSDATLLSALGRLHLQLGSVASAEAIFRRVVADAAADADRSALCRMNQGYLSLAADRFDEAAQHFAAAFELDPASIASLRRLSHSFDSGVR
jgi:trafficking protein particle complex subunit 12